MSDLRPGNKGKTGHLTQRSAECKMRPRFRKPWIYGTFSRCCPAVGKLALYQLSYARVLLFLGTRGTALCRPSYEV